MGWSRGLLGSCVLLTAGWFIFVLVSAYNGWPSEREYVTLSEYVQECATFAFLPPAILIAFGYCILRAGQRVEHDSSGGNAVVLLTIALGGIMLFGFSGVTHAGERRASVETHAETSENAKARYYRSKRPLELNIYAPRRRVGGYSYRASDVVNTYGSSPPPWADIKQTPSGPFDSGFFFDSGIGPHGGNSPYLH